MDRWARCVRQGWWALLAVAWLGMLAQAGRAETAVVVVGPVDPPVNRETRTYIAEANSVARVLTQAGYDVVKLYHPQATWERVKEAAQGASVFVYFGHGNGYGWQGQTEPEAINGLCLSYPDNPDADSLRQPRAWRQRGRTRGLGTERGDGGDGAFLLRGGIDDGRSRGGGFRHGEGPRDELRASLLPARVRRSTRPSRSPGRRRGSCERRAHGVSAAEAVRQGERAPSRACGIRPGAGRATLSV